MKIALALLYLLPNLWAQSPQRKPLEFNKIIFNPGGRQVGRFVISYKDYEDIRIDSNGDSQIDYWFLKKGSTEIHLRFKAGRPNKLSIKKTEPTQVTEVSYTIAGSKILLDSALKRPLILMNLTSEEAQCEIEQIQQKMKSFSNDIVDAVIKDSISSKLISPECHETLNRKNLNQIQSALYGILNTNIKRESDIRNCLSSDKFESAAKEEPQLKLPAALISARFQLQIAQLTQQPEDNAPLIRCEKAEGQESLLSTTEKRQIHVNLDKLAGSDARIQSRDLEHELLHRSGLTSEEEVNAVVAICKKLEVRRALNTGSFGFTRDVSADVKKSFETVADSKTADTLSTAESGISTSSPQASTSRGPASTGSEMAAAQLTANIPQEMTMSSTDMPLATTLSESISTPAPATETGAQQALLRSASESNGLLRMANNLVGTMSSPALASDRTTSTSTTTKKSSPVEFTSRNRLAPGEKVVEEITLENSTPQKAEASPSSPTASPSSGREVSTSSPAPTVSSSGEVARSASEASPSRAPATIAETGTRLPASTKAVAKTSSASSTMTKTQDEVLTFISNSSYTATKEKLQKAEFRQQLEIQKITVMDLYGNTIGAKKGDVIFLDQGDRFVRQK
ncbi:MAG: hypothetical protein KUL82_04925 [Bdellovibrio sp.]|nr:hypothetical protein [Bdellovibrio sp.]